VNTAYRHRFADGTVSALPVGKVVCVGRNYAAHARELNNPVPAAPLLFLKPPSALTPLEQPIVLPAGRGAVHHELEIALLVGDGRQPGSVSCGPCSIAGIGLALDLTLRDLQDRLKRDGHPWDIAKGFAGACPCSRFVPPAGIEDWRALSFELLVNGCPRQAGNAGDMLFSYAELLASMAFHFGLAGGDVVLTGTPPGVAALQPGDRLLLRLGDYLEAGTRVAS
jgi:2-keto-4-pentenoate hydratase/2-oxohepta-3-ene-1,7-dioic acid hydratase in catechol pathway